MRVEDHPRLRGEHSLRSKLNGHTEGSSPLTRGAQVAHRLHVFRGRIIPAYAGSTELLAVENLRYKDHPRLRGEHGTCKPSHA